MLFKVAKLTCGRQQEIFITAKHHRQKIIPLTTCVLIDRLLLLVLNWAGPFRNKSEFPLELICANNIPFAFAIDVRSFATYGDMVQNAAGGEGYY